MMCCRLQLISSGSMIVETKIWSEPYYQLNKRCCREVLYVNSTDNWRGRGRQRDQEQEIHTPHQPFPSVFQGHSCSCNSPHTKQCTCSTSLSLSYLLWLFDLQQVELDLQRTSPLNFLQICDQLFDCLQDMYKKFEEMMKSVVVSYPGMFSRIPRLLRGWGHGIYCLHALNYSLINIDHVPLICVLISVHQIMSA